MKKILLPLRQKLHKNLISQTDKPLIIYLAIILGIGLALLIKPYHDDLSLSLVSEIIGAAFIIFVIDVLLVKSKTKRWLIVQDHIDYLIARTVNRLRDGMSSRAFYFQPLLKTQASEDDNLQEIREQRDIFLHELAALSSEHLASRFSKELFSEDNYEYFNEKAADIWDLLNMKYSEYLAPQLVSLLIELHTNLKDVCAHIRLYKKAERFPKEQEYYQSSGIKGAAGNMKEIIRIVILLKEEGYSEPARRF